MKKVLFPLCLINVMLLLSCGVNKIENEQAESRAYDVSPKIGEENTEFNDHIILYDIPLEEIAKRIENEYVYENMIDRIAEWKQKELGLLPANQLKRSKIVIEVDSI